MGGPVSAQVRHSEIEGGSFKAIEISILEGLTWESTITQVNTTTSVVLVTEDEE